MTMTPNKQGPQECEYYCKGKCNNRVVIAYNPRLTMTADTLYDLCRGICPDFTPKTDKDGK